MNEFMSKKRPEDFIDIGDQIELGHNEMKYANFNFNGENVKDIKDKKRKLMQNVNDPDDKKQKLMNYAKTF